MRRMMNSMKIEDLRNRWQNIKVNRGLFQRLDPTHPLDFFIGIDENNFKEIILLTEYEPSKMKSSKSIQVEKGIRDDKKWAIQIKLIKEEHEDVFIRLCWDLIDSSKKITDKLKGVESVVSRFAKWQKLMEFGSDCLTDEVIKGIIGEMLYIKHVLLDKYDLDTIVNSWLGPNGSDRDFVFKETWTEVKAIGSGKLTVCISSLEQLNIMEEGILAIAIVDPTSEADVNGFNFSSVVNKFRLLLKANPSALYSFEEKLINIGYYDRKEYEEKYYTFSGFKFYKVDNTFPKLTNENVRNEIVKVKYEIAISAIGKWQSEGI
jgi:hypothetical protein